MQNLKNIVPTLTGQHRLLQKDLGDIAELLKIGSPDYEKVSELLSKFSKDLMEHLHLENDLFYVELLKKMKVVWTDTAETEAFIGEMKAIEDTVQKFLSKYKGGPEIKNSADSFPSEFSLIVNTLNIRIESEESGVYGYWDLYNKE